jgi:hypothetical protein
MNCAFAAKLEELRFLSSFRSGIGLRRDGLLAGKHCSVQP